MSNEQHCFHRWTGLLFSSVLLSNKLGTQHVSHCSTLITSHNQPSPCCLNLFCLRVWSTLKFYYMIQILSMKYNPRRTGYLFFIRKKNVLEMDKASAWEGWGILPRFTMLSYDIVPLSYDSSVILEDDCNAYKLLLIFLQCSPLKMALYFLMRNCPIIQCITWKFLASSIQHGYVSWINDYYSSDLRFACIEGPGNNVIKISFFPISSSVNMLGISPFAVWRFLHHCGQPDQITDLQRLCPSIRLPLSFL